MLAGLAVGSEAGGVVSIVGKQTAHDHPVVSSPRLICIQPVNPVKGTPTANHGTPFLYDSILMLSGGCWAMPEQVIL